MNTAMLLALCGIALFAAGVAGVILQSHLLRKIIAFNIMGSGAFLVLVGLGQRGGGTDPRIDPVAQAMVLTGIVVSVAATALALALARRLLNLTGEMRFPGTAADD